MGAGGDKMIPQGDKGSTPHITEPGRDAPLPLGAEAPSWPTDAVTSSSTGPLGPVERTRATLGPAGRSRHLSKRPGVKRPVKKPEKYRLETTGSGKRPQHAPRLAGRGVHRQASGREIKAGITASGSLGVNP